MGNKNFVKEEENKGISTKGGNQGSRGGRRGGRDRRFKSGSKGNFNSSSAKKGLMFNDVSWYTKNKIITDAFGKLPYSMITGATLPNCGNKTVKISTVISYVVDWLASPKPRFDVATGSNPYITTKDSSILDQIKTILYTEIRRANSGAKNDYEPIDVMISNLIAAIDIICNSVYLASFFKIANTFSWKNRQIPHEIFQHRGIDYEEFIGSQARYRGKFDTLIAYAKTIRCLSKYPFIQAAYSEYLNIFKDEDTDTGREQLIVPVKAFHHIFDPLGTEDLPGGCVRLMRENDIPYGMESDDIIMWTGAKYANCDYMHTFDDLLNVFQTQIKALIDNSDFNLIQGDLEKAFGDASGYWEPAAVDTDVNSGITPIYSGEFSTMMHNGVFLPLPGFRLSTGDIESYKNCYVNTVSQKTDPSNPTAGTTFIFGQLLADFADNGDVYANLEKFYNLATPDNFYGGFVSTDTADPTPEDNIIMSRYKNMFNKTDRSALPDAFRTTQTSIQAVYGVFGSNFITFGNMISCVRYYRNTAVTERMRWDGMIHGVFTSDTSYYRDVQPMLGAFKCRPVRWIYQGAGESDRLVPNDEVNNIRFMTPSELTAINDSCFLSLWNLPDKTNI